MKPEENNGFTVSPQIVNNRRISRKTMSTDRFCLICHDKIHDRHYKIASSLSSINQLIIEITASSETSVGSLGNSAVYLCPFCVSKLQKLSKLDNHIKTKCAQLQQKHDGLFCYLKKSFLECS